jgi:hypothetical protein
LTSSLSSEAAVDLSTTFSGLAIRKDGLRSNPHLEASDFVGVNSAREPAGFVVESQGDLFEVKRKGLSAIGGGRRGKVKAFSRGSRIRLMKRLARVGNSVGVTLWVTLTFPASFPVSCTQRYLERFRSRMEYHCGRLGVVWVREFQERGAVHWHLLMCLPSGLKGLVDHRPSARSRGWPMSKRETYRFVRFQWGACVGEFMSERERGMLGEDCGFSNVQFLMSADKPKRYLCKYASKLQQKEGAVETEVSCEAGFDGDVDVPPVESSVLDNGTYLQKVGEDSGRWWGVWRPELIPWGDLQSFVLPWSRAFFLLRRVCRRFLPSIGRYGPSGWFLLGHDSFRLLSCGVLFDFDERVSLSA